MSLRTKCPFKIMIFIVTLLGTECELLTVMIMINLLEGGAEYKPKTLTS